MPYQLAAAASTSASAGARCWATNTNTSEDTSTGSHAVSLAGHRRKSEPLTYGTHRRIDAQLNAEIIDKRYFGPSRPDAQTRH